MSTSVSETTKQILTDKKVNIVWQNQYKAQIDSVLFLLYTGFNISEISIGANKICIDKIVRHKSTATRERIYTHNTIEVKKAKY